jgi:hypothetical protein
MKTIVLLVLLTFAVALYFGYGPYDLVTMFQPKPAAAVVKHNPDQRGVAEPPLRSVGTPVVAQAPDGSLDARWTPYPSISPAQGSKP